MSDEITKYRCDKCDKLLPAQIRWMGISICEGCLDKHYSEKKEEDVNTPQTDPKGAAGKMKDQLQLIPTILERETAKALDNGAKKYQPFNWRFSKVESMTYIGAIRRHLNAYFDGEELDPESGAHHLGHIAANCAILLDAAEQRTLEDNRPGRRISLKDQPPASPGSHPDPSAS